MNRGMSLLELLIVMALMGLVLSLIGPLGMRQVERGEAVYESMQLQQLLNQVQQQAYVQATPVVLELDGKVMRRLEHAELIADYQFKHIFFPPQQIQINSHGIAQQRQLDALVRGNARIFELETSDAKPQ